jgi:hypothetical protein
MTDLHFLDETENEWRGPYLLRKNKEETIDLKRLILIDEKYVINLLPSQTLVRCCADRLFYYPGQEVFLETFIDNKCGTHTLHELTIKLVRIIKGQGRSPDKKQTHTFTERSFLKSKIISQLIKVQPGFVKDYLLKF